TVELHRHHPAHRGRTDQPVLAILEAAFLDHTSGSRIGYPRGAPQLVQPAGAEGEINDRMRGFRGEAAAPIRLADPIDEMHVAGIAEWAIAARADQRLARLAQRDRK